MNVCDQFGHLHVLTKWLYEGQKLDLKLQSQLLLLHEPERSVSVIEV